MKILSNKLVIGLIVLIVLAMFTMIGFYFGIRWASQDVLGFDSQPDRLTVDLEQKRVELEEWSNDLLNQFPDVPAAQATVAGYREILSQIIARNEQLRQEGVSMKKRVNKLTQFGKEISPSIAQRTRAAELHLELMRENSELKGEIDRYMHKYVMVPVPIYLYGLNKADMQALQEQLQESQRGN